MNPSMHECGSVTALKRESPRAPATASQRIRRRLAESGHRSHANDNIADFIEGGDLDELRSEVEDKLRQVLDALVIDTAHDHNPSGTTQRVARMYLDEVFRDRYQPAAEVTAFPNVAHLAELMVIGPVTVRRACSHHLCPITGRVWIGVLPHAESQLIGLSRYTRICEWVMSRPRIQEEAVVMLADELERRVQPEGLAIVMEATHFCTRWRGVKDAASRVRNTVMRGAFSTSAELRREFFGQLDHP